MLFQATHGRPSRREASAQSRRCTFPKLFSGPFGAPRMRENVCGSPVDVGTFMAPGEAVKLFDAGSCCGGLRIVATSTRVRLFLFPRVNLSETRS